MRIPRAVVVFLCAEAMMPKPSEAMTGYCYDFNPGIAYQPVTIPSAAVKAPFDNAVSYALASTFSEQIAINSLIAGDGYFSQYSLTDIKSALSAALGIGQEASFLFEPLEPEAKNSDISIKLIPSDESSILSDTSAIYLSRGFLKRISDQAIKTSFGSSDKYKAHLKDLSQHDFSQFVNANKLTIDKRENTRVPLGYILFGKDLVSTDPVVESVKLFTKEFLIKLLFATAHEIGHIRLHHHHTKYASCEEFEQRELAADAYAAKYLAQFSFRMQPDNPRKQYLVEFDVFFQSYRQYEFSDTSAEGTCLYPPAKQRAKQLSTTVAFVSKL